MIDREIRPSSRQRQSRLIGSLSQERQLSFLEGLRDTHAHYRKRAKEVAKKPTERTWRYIGDWSTWVLRKTQIQNAIDGSNLMSKKEKASRPQLRLTLGLETSPYVQHVLVVNDLFIYLLQLAIIGRDMSAQTERRMFATDQ